MTVRVYDGRTNTWRSVDAPYPLSDELVLSVWDGEAPRRQHDRATATAGSRSSTRWHHDVYRRIGAIEYEFIGTAPDHLGVPSVATRPWVGITRPHSLGVHPFTPGGRE